MLRRTGLKLLSPVLAAGLIAGSAAAQEVGDYAFSLGVSTVGLNVEGAYRFSEKFRVRGIISAAPEDRSRQEAGGITYDSKAEIKGLTVLADYGIGRTPFRLTAGAFVSGAQVIGNARGNLLIGDSVYLTSLRAEAEFVNSVAPLVSVGFDLPIGENWGLTGDLGYIFTGGVNVKLSASSVAVDPADLFAEQRQIERQVLTDGYPFLNIGLRFTF